jgi:hypothetical protein
MIVAAEHYRYNSLFEGAQELFRNARDVNSQAGEDGIIDCILKRLERRDLWCVELGAWDGRYLSNTRRLIDEENYNGVMIEGSRRNFRKLAADFRGNGRVYCIQAYVGFNDNNGLDSILSDTPCPRNFDVLSVDIDGNDIHVWAATNLYRPKLVCIEFNPTIPTPVAFVQPKRADCKWGASLRSLFELGLQKRYRLVCANACNAFFVAEEHWKGEYARASDELSGFRIVEPAPVYLFSGYDGTVLLSRTGKLNWHGIDIARERVQVLPKLLRKYPEDYMWYHRLIFAVARRLRTVARSTRLPWKRQA